MMIKKIYAMVLVGVSATCFSGEHCDTEQAMRKRHQHIKDTTQEINTGKPIVLHNSDKPIVLYNPDQVRDFIEKTKNNKQRDEIKDSSGEHYVFVTHYGRIVSVMKVSRPKL